MKRFWAFFLCLILSFTFCACNKSTETDDVTPFWEREDEQETKTAPLFSLPYLANETLDPIACPDGVNQAVSGLIYEGLFVLNDKFEAEKQLCDEYTYDAARKTYEFSIRENVRFSDGATLQASDVIASLKRAQNSARYGARFADVVSFAAPDSDTVRIILQIDNAAFPAVLDIPIVKAGTENRFIPLGTGPYCQATQSDLLVPNTVWWQGEKQPLKQIQLVELKSESNATSLFSAYDINLLVTHLGTVEPFGKDISVNVTDVPSAELLYLGCNFYRAATASAQMRRALSLGIDRKNIVSAYLAGHAAATDVPLSPASTYYDRPSADYLPSAYADALSAIHPSHTALTLIVNEDNSYKVSLAQAIAASLSAGSVSVNVRVLPWTDYCNALASGSYDLYLAQTRLTADFNSSPLFTPGGSLQYGAHSDETASALYAYLSAPGKKTAAAFCNAFAENMPFIPIAFLSMSVMRQSNFSCKITPSPTTPFYRFDQWVFEDKK